MEETQDLKARIERLECLAIAQKPLDQADQAELQK